MVSAHLFETLADQKTDYSIRQMRGLVGTAIEETEKEEQIESIRTMAVFSLVQILMSNGVSRSKANTLGS